MMTTKEAAIDSVREFEEARKAENYSMDTPTVLKSVAFMEYDRQPTGLGLGFSIKAGVSDHGDGKGWVGNGTWEASLKERSIVYVGDSPEAAIGAMLVGVARLAYDGSMHPDHPEDMGAPPIQHAINVLTDRLKWQTERREDAVRDLTVQAGMSRLPPSPDIKTNLYPGLDRNNQIIAALGTAIAALGRVNDL